MAASVAGGLIAFYQIGYGIAAFGVGPLQRRAGLELERHLRWHDDIRADDGGRLLSSRAVRPACHGDFARSDLRPGSNNSHH